MDQIEVYIKVTPINQVYSLPIRKSETILKLKEYCKVLSKIPENQQDLLYKGNILLNEKIISDYDIKDNGNILLIKKEEPKPGNIPIKQNFNNSNENENVFNINIPNNDEINVNEIANACKRVQFQDVISFFENTDLDKIDDYYKLMGIKFSDIFGMEPQIFKKGLKDPSFRNKMNNILILFKDPSLLEMWLKNPVIQDKIKNIPYFKFIFQNPQIFSNPKYLQMIQNIFKKNESNLDENSNSKKNSLHQIPNILNLCENILNFNFSNNKIDTYLCKQFQSQDFLSLYDNIDLDKLSYCYKSMGLKFSDIFGAEPPEFKEMLKDPSYRSSMNSVMNILKDSSICEMLLKDPEAQAMFKNYSLMKKGSHNPEILLSPQMKQLYQIMFPKKNESNPIENSISKNLFPPDPFGSLNNIQNFNSINNNSNEIEIDYKEKK